MKSCKNRKPDIYILYICSEKDLKINENVLFSKSVVVSLRKIMKMNDFGMKTAFILDKNWCKIWRCFFEGFAPRSEGYDTLFPGIKKEAKKQSMDW